MNDDWTPDVVDDPAPPEPDAAVLARVVGRGRQRLVRRRAILGASAASVAVLLVGTGVSVAQRRDASPDIAVNPPTTIAQDARITERAADANGLHFTLTLATPEVVVSGAVEVVLQVDNRTGAVAYFRSCDIARVVISDPDSTWIAKNEFCNPARFGLQPENSFSWTPPAIAPDSPGDYSVTVTPAPGFVLPAALLQPLSLRVVAAASATTSSPPATGSASTYESPPLGGASPTTAVTPVEDTRIPHLDDFSGTLTADETTIAWPDEEVSVDLHVQNVTDHVVDPNTVAIVCTSDLSADGLTTKDLRSNENLFFLVSPTLAPGEGSGRTGTFRPAADDIGTITCAAVIVVSDHSFQDGTIQSVGRITKIPTVSFSVYPNRTVIPAPGLGTVTTTVAAP